MSAFKLHTLKQKLWAIVAASFVARVVIFFALPNTPTSIAPDEGSYSEITRRILTGETIDQIGRLSKTSQTLVFPATMFARLGLDPLSATRLSALMYGIATLAFTAYFISKVAQRYLESAPKHKNSMNPVLILFAIYSFLPSHLLWSTLALRESTMEFWVVLIFGSIFLIMHQSVRPNLLNYLILISSIFLLYNTRLQVGLLLTLSLVISLPLLIKVRNAQKVFITVVMSSALSFSSLFIQTQLEFTIINLDAPTSNAPTVDPALCKKNGEIILRGTSRFLCKEVTRVTVEDGTRPDDFIVGQITSIPDRHKANQANASSAIQTISCPFEREREANEIACLIWRAPYMTMTFLIRPIVGLDVTSASSLFAAVENLMWSAGFIFIIFTVAIKRKILFVKPLLPPVVFLILYSVGAGSYEGNLGTAFRHKSLILWIVLLLTFAVIWRRPNEPKESLVNNSQEKAV